MFPLEARKQVQPSQTVISRDFTIVMVNFFASIREFGKMSSANKGRGFMA